MRDSIIITPDELLDFNNSLVQEQARIDREMLEVLDENFKPEKTMDYSTMLRVIEVAKAYNERKKFSGTEKWFTEESGFPITSLPKQKAFFEATRSYRQVMFRASNRTSKTISGSYAVSCWSTGVYPSWWEGRVFDGPTRGWACSDTKESTRDLVQKELMGPLGAWGTGMIPKERIGKIIMRPGISGAIDTVQVFNDWGDPSLIGFKSYIMGLDAFKGTANHWHWNDEEPPFLIHNEAFIRLATTQGVLINTVTPLHGLTPYLLAFEKSADMLGDSERCAALTDDELKTFNEHPRFKAIIGAGWKDAPWLSEQDKRQMLEDTPPNLREARMTGKPSMGSGLIYPVNLEEVLIDDADFQKIKGPHFKYMNAIDVGWNKTAVCFGAINPDDDVLYIYDEYYQGEQRPEVHAVAIKSKGNWIPNVIDPASRGRSQIDGNKMITLYIQSGLQVQPANNAVEAGIMEVYTRLATGRMKIVRQKCKNLVDELRMYRRDDNGKIIKEKDHLADTIRYLAMDIKKAICKPVTNQFGGGSGAKKYF